MAGTHRVGHPQAHVSGALTFTKQDLTFASAEFNRASFALPDLLPYTHRGTDTVLGLRANETRGSRLEICNRTPTSNRVAWLHGLRPHVSAGVTCGYLTGSRVYADPVFFSTRPPKSHRSSPAEWSEQALPEKLTSPWRSRPWRSSPYGPRCVTASHRIAREHEAGIRPYRGVPRDDVARVGIDLSRDQVRTRELPAVPADGDAVRHGSRYAESSRLTGNAFDESTLPAVNGNAYASGGRPSIPPERLLMASPVDCPRQSLVASSIRKPALASKTARM
jgi:hypothetical protein